MIKQDLQHWFDGLPLDDRLRVQKFMIILYYVGDIQNE